MIRNAEKVRALAIKKIRFITIIHPEFGFSVRNFYKFKTNFPNSGWIPLNIFPRIPIKEEVISMNKS